MVHVDTMVELIAHPLPASTFEMWILSLTEANFFVSANLVLLYVKEGLEQKSCDYRAHRKMIQPKTVLSPL